MLVIALCLGVLIVQGVSGQPCKGYTTCNDCIRSSPQCVWCDNLTYENDSCFERDNNASRLMCGAKNVVDVVGSLNITEVDKTLDTIVDLERVAIRTRPNKVNSFIINIHIPLNYPLDFYYLMDFSCSMANDLETIQGLSTDIIGTLKNLTTDFRVGFGAFSDKEALPFTFERKESPFCVSGKDRTVPLDPQHIPFNYIHYLSLTDNQTLFIDSISQLNITSNIDNPESTLDALMQAAVCNELIGWRPAASHIVLVASDAAYHIAGDGKVVGALKPNDGKCHMSRSDEGEGIYQYDQSLQLDYPSIGQVEAVLRQRNIVPIFAIAKDVQASKSVEQYMDLRSQLQTTSFLDELEPDSGNILPLIRDGYNSLSQNIRLSFSTPEGVSIEIQPLCNQTDGSACTGIQRNETVEFNVSVTVTDCTKLKSLRQNILLEYAFLTVSVPIELEALCDCDCTANRGERSGNCSNHGDIECGRCQCDDDRFGRFCECEFASGADRSVDQGTGHDQCMRGTNGLLCSGHGECVCNQCMCELNFKGEACEDQCRCPTDENGMECGGADNGNCSCITDVNADVNAGVNGKCECNDTRFTGDSCDCPIDTTACMTESTLCSGNGTCECNKCTCAPTCLGEVCERCRDKLLQCAAHRPCVQCELSSANYSNSIRRRITRPENCENQCFSETVSIAPVESSLVTTYTIDGSETIRCRLSDRDNCFYVYYVALDSENNLHPIRIEDSLSCEGGTSDSTSNLIWIIPVAIVIGLLVIGLIILLIIKLCLIMLDYVEVRQFEKSVRDAEGKLAQTSQPLYQSPVVEYQNLAYGKEKKDEK
ncbi:integrin beta-1-like [Dysidea avara]|uniref:integrin beta-1-like n=1 Tax=Dysidea avara TaxID=196820 RepID=UPI00331D8B44